MAEPLDCTDGTLVENHCVTHYETYSTLLFRTCYLEGALHLHVCACMRMHSATISVLLLDYSFDDECDQVKESWLLLWDAD